jgi:anthranilate synthase component 1
MSDSLSPVQAFARLDQGVAAGLFESVIGGEKVGRYSFVASDPFLLIQARGTAVTIKRRKASSSPSPSGRGQGEGAANTRATPHPNPLPKGEEGEATGWETTQHTVDNPLETLRREVQAVRVAHLAELPPFIGGAVGYAGYDTVRYVEHLPNAPQDDRGLPDLAFGLFDHMVVFDNVRKTVHVLVLADVRGAANKADLERRYTTAATRIDAFVAALSKPDDGLTLVDIDARGDVQLKYQANMTQAEYEAAVRKCVEYIRAGDIFQVVVGQRLAVPFTLPPFELYRTLRVVNPSPFMFYLRMPDVTLVGSSPEIMVRVIDGKVTVRPLAGTRRRGATEEEDKALAEELLADPKERAEHIMLVDLGRNDVGRVARFGTVEISDVMVVERYSHVMHITSNVTGQLRDDCDAFDALAACLPAGTVSGAPQGAGDADHRRNRTPPPRPLRRRRGIHRLRRQHGHLHRAPHGRRAKQRRLRPSRRRPRRRQRPNHRIRRNAQQSPRHAQSDRDHAASCNVTRRNRRRLTTKAQRHEEKEGGI